MEENNLNNIPTSNNQNSKMGLGITIGALLMLVLCLGGYFVYNEFVKKDDTNKENNNIVKPSETSQPINQNQSQTNKKIVEVEFDPNNTEALTTKKIVLGNKEKTLTRMDNVIQLDDVAIFPEENLNISLTWLHNIFVFDDSILIITAGSVPGSDKYYIYDDNLKETKEISMTLDENYPNSMRAAAADEQYKIDGNKIIIKGYRSNGEFGGLRTESGMDVWYCENKSFVSTYKGELFRANYEIEYLGNGKFSNPKRITGSETYLNENSCN